jgi:hypothetical protein
MKWFAFFILYANVHSASYPKPWEDVEQIENGIVTAQLIGQLGNQMFQIAAAVGYALDHGYQYRFPSLIDAIYGGLNYVFVFHRLNIDPFPTNVDFYHHFELDHMMHEPISSGSQNNVCLHGYFPHEKYFLKHSNVIKELFSPTEDLMNKIFKKYGDLLSRSPVAIHVRTFLPDHIDPTNGIGRTKWQYYINALQMFPEESIFLVFSDDMEWTKNHFPMIRKNIFFVENNPHYFDFYLMSACNHQIVAPHSTFSWWAAWLNQNPDKIVIVPENLGVAGDSNFPTNWIRIKTEKCVGCP